MEKVVCVDVVVELQILRIAILFEQLDYPFLLFRRQQQFAMVIAIVVALAVQIDVQGVVQDAGMLAFHLFKKLVEAPRHALRLLRSVEPAALFTYLDIRIDGRTPVVVVTQVLSSQIAQTLVLLGTLAVKAQLIPSRHIAKIKFSYHSGLFFLRHERQ